MYHFEYTYARLLRTYVHKTYVFEVSHQILSNMCARLPRTYVHAFQKNICFFSFSSNSFKYMCARLQRTYMHAFLEHTCTFSSHQVR